MKPILDYAEYLALPVKKREQYPKPVMTLGWYDRDALLEVTSQSWFGRLRQQLNDTGKVTINLGVFKYEQGGAKSEDSEQDIANLAKLLFEKAEYVTAPHFNVLLSDWIQRARGTFLEPSLVVIDGPLNVVFHVRHNIDTTFHLLAGQLGYKVEGPITQTILTEESLMRINGMLNEYIGDTYSEDMLNEQIRTNAVSLDSFNKISHGGKDYAYAVMLGRDNADEEDVIHFDVALPFDALHFLKSSAGFNGRVLGWVEHAAGDSFFIRAVAWAYSDIILNKEEWESVTK